MIAVREEKLAANKKVISDVEVQVVTMIRVARSKLTNLNALLPKPILNGVQPQAIQPIFKFKDGPHLQDLNHKVPDYEYPQRAQLSYENYIIGFITKSGGYYGHNFIMSNGNKSELPYK